MKILVTEAVSPLAYHLTALIGAGDIIPDKDIELILCDSVDKEDVVLGLAYELQDCVFPSLKSATVTNDLCSSLKEVDMAIILPVSEATPNCRKCGTIEIRCTSLTQVNFRFLDGAFCNTGFETNEVLQVKTRGPLSAARAVGECVKQRYAESLAETLRQNLLLHEEAEFGFASYPVEHTDEHTDTGVFDHVTRRSGMNRLSLVFVSTKEPAKLESTDNTLEAGIQSRL